MKVPIWLFLVSIALVCRPAACKAQQEPTLTTYVLSSGTASFRVEDYTVVCTEGVTVTLLESTPETGKTYRRGVKACQPWTVGRRLKIWGKRSGQGHTLVAEQIAVDDRQPKSVAGFALIDRILQPESSGSMAFRADGYVLHATPATKVGLAQAAIKTLAAVQTNVWVRYMGELQPDGSVQVVEMTTTPNSVVATESKLREKSQFNAAAVKESDRQGGANKFFLGLNNKKIPAYDDAAMQARVTRIGDSLVPAYQRALPVGDPSQIPFTFQLVDLERGPEAIALPSGIILVPYQIMDGLNDAQLAAILATNIGTVLQKQDLRFLPTAYAITAANITAAVGAFFVPGLYVATSVGTAIKESAVLKAAREQDQRVAMCLMHDAGYDLTEVPMAWWLLHSNPKKIMPNGAMPPASEYAYHLLGTVWRNALVADAGISPK